MIDLYQDVLFVPIRENRRIGIVHLPHDLTKQEADKISKIILAHASEETKE